MKKLLILVFAFLLFSSTAHAYQYSNTIDFTGYEIAGIGSIGSNLLIADEGVPNGSPASVKIFDTSGSLLF
jgi:hypothetical protein